MTTTRLPPKSLPLHAAGFLDLLFPEGDTDDYYIEVRLLRNQNARNRKFKYPESGFFNDRELALSAILANHANRAVYIGLNPRIADVRHIREMNVLGDGDAGGIKHVYCKRWLFIDVDSDRLRNTAATNEELKISYDVLLKIKDDLERHGVHPVVGFSGNGWHLLVRTIDYQVDDDRHRQILCMFGSQYDSGIVHVDTGTHDAPRIIKMYGTASIKGSNTEERPWRTAKLITIQPETNKPARGIPSVSPEPVDIFDIYKDELEVYNTNASVSKIPIIRNREKQTSNSDNRWWSVYTGDIRTLDIVGLFQSAGLHTKFLHDEMYAVQCPWDSSHTSGNIGDSSTVIFDTANGEFSGFNCKHSHCQNKTLEDVLAFFSRSVVDSFCSEIFVKQSDKPETETSHLTSDTATKKTDGNNTSDTLQRLLDAEQTVDDGRTILHMSTQIESITALYDELKKKEDIYEFNGSVVQVSVDGQIHIFTKESFIPYISRQFCIKIKKQTGKVAQWVPDTISTRIANLALHDQYCIFSLPHLEGIKTAPYYNKMWDAVGNIGYSAQDAIYYAGPIIYARENPETMPDMPYLFKAIKDFPFRTEGDKVRYLAIVISQLFSNIFAGAHPMLIVDGNGQHIGKSKLAQIVSIIRDDTVTPVKADTRNEMEKRIVAAMRSGVSCFMLDNMMSTRSAIYETLAELITSPVIKLRLLSLNDLYTINNDIQFCYTSNDDKYSTDILTRSFVVSLYREGRNIPDFEIEDPVEFVKTHRLEIISEIMGVIDFWKRSGMKQVKVKSRFAKYARHVAGILSMMWMELNPHGGNDDILDPSQDELYKLRAFLPLNYMYTAAEFVEQAETCDAFLGIRSGRGKRGAAIAMGKILSRYLGEVFDNAVLTKYPQSGRALKYAFVGTESCETNGANETEGNKYQDNYSDDREDGFLSTF